MTHWGERAGHPVTILFPHPFCSLQNCEVHIIQHDNNLFNIFVAVPQQGSTPLGREGAHTDRRLQLRVHTPTVESGRKLGVRGESENRTHKCEAAAVWP